MLWKSWVLINSVGKTLTVESQKKGGPLGTESSCAGSFWLPVALAASSGAPRASWGQDRDTGTSLLSSLRCQGCTPWGAGGCWLLSEIGEWVAGRKLRQMLLLPWKAEETGKHLPPALSRQKIPHHYFWWWPMLAEREEKHPFYN